MTHRSVPPLLVIVTVVLALGVTGCSPDPVAPLPIGATDGWELFHPRPVGYDLNSVWGATASQVWAVGAHGVIVHWDGRSVRRVDSPTSVELESVVARGFNDAYAAGGDVVLHYDGRTWEVWDRIAGAHLRQLHLDPDGRLLLVGSEGLLVREGDSWRAIDGPSENSAAVWTGPDGLTRVGDGLTIWRVIGGQATPELQLANGQVVSGDGGIAVVEGDDIDHLYRLGHDGVWRAEFFHYRIRAAIDGGCSIFADNGGIQACGQEIWDNAHGRWIDALAWCGDGGLLACGYGGTLLYTANSSAPEPTWNEASESIGFRHANAFSGRGCDDIWAAEWYGRVLHYDGQQWWREQAPLLADEPVTSIWALDDGWVAVADWRDIALRRPDGQWTRIAGPGGQILAMLALAHDDVLASTFSGIHRWDGGAWSTIELGDRRARDLAVTPSGVVYALVVDDATTLRRVDGHDTVIVATLPGLSGQVLEASRACEDVWIASHDYAASRQTLIHRFREGAVVEVAAAQGFAARPVHLTELRCDDLFVLADDRVWRYLDGAWSLQTGLPASEDYDAIWSHPDCGVFVQGHPTYFKAY